MMQEQVLAALRGQLGDIILGTLFVVIGLAAGSVAAMRRHGAVRIFIWLGAWSAMYGIRLLARSPAILAALPPWARTGARWLDVFCMYHLLVAAALAWMELSIGKMRLFFYALIATALAIGIAGIAWYAFTGSPDELVRYNNALGSGALAVLVTVVAIPKLCARSLVLPHRGVLATGSLVFAIEALSVNLIRPLHLELPAVLDSLGFAALLFSFGYVALRIAAANEVRLLSVEKELEIARQLQRAALPAAVPEIRGVRIAAVYEPMTAVGGDFYDFVPVDPHRIGFLVADVSGHGVPAALTAAMIKTAMHSVAACADDPRQVLRGLDRILSAQLHGQFVSAAYLWIDTQLRSIRYSAAGHPPLLCWRNGELRRIESNGLLFGVIPGSDYPVCEIPLLPRDRFLLYTDGATEPENDQGEAFGDRRLEALMRACSDSPPSELSALLLTEIRVWQPHAAAPQDDITLVAIDID